MINVVGRPNGGRGSGRGSGSNPGANQSRQNPELADSAGSVELEIAPVDREDAGSFFPFRDSNEGEEICVGTMLGQAEWGLHMILKGEVAASWRTDR